jgi:hypothetical protein
MIFATFVILSVTGAVIPCTEKEAKNVLSHGLTLWKARRYAEYAGLFHSNATRYIGTKMDPLTNGGPVTASQWKCLAQYVNQDYDALWFETPDSFHRNKDHPRPFGMNYYNAIVHGLNYLNGVTSPLTVAMAVGKTGTTASCVIFGELIYATPNSVLIKTMDILNRICGKKRSNAVMKTETYKKNNM